MSGTDVMECSVCGTPNCVGCGSVGAKHDRLKPRWSLLPQGTVGQVVEVLEFGARKYTLGGWLQVPNPERRYYDAAMRHLESWRNRQMKDAESGLPHLAHAVCCLLFLMWFDNKAPIPPEQEKMACSHLWLLDAYSWTLNKSNVWICRLCGFEKWTSKDARKTD